MRWAEDHVDPMLSLRNLICNDRWAEGWQQIQTFRQEQRWMRQHIRQSRPALPPIPIVPNRESRQPTIPLQSPADDTTPRKPWRPPDNHPWRRPWLHSRT